MTCNSAPDPMPSLRPPCTQTHVCRHTYIHKIMKKKTRKERDDATSTRLYNCRKVFNVEDVLTRLKQQMGMRGRKQSRGVVVGTKDVREKHLRTVQWTRVTLKGLVPNPNDGTVVVFTEQQTSFMTQLTVNVQLPYRSYT